MTLLEAPLRAEALPAFAEWTLLLAGPSCLLTSATTGRLTEDAPLPRRALIPFAQ